MNVEFRPVPWAELEPWRKDAAREHSDIAPLPSITWFAATLGGSKLGCIGLLRVSKTTVRVRGWYVRPECRGQGVGMFLHESAEEWAARHGYERIESTTRLWEVLLRRGWVVLRRYTPAVGTKMTRALSDPEGRAGRTV